MNKSKYRQKKNNLVHAIVGFGIFEYFKNSIKSILVNDTRSRIIVITTGSPRLFGWKYLPDQSYEDVTKIKKYISSVNRHEKNKIIYHELNEKSQSDKSLNKLGLLYEANNLAIGIAHKLKFRYLNLMQCDQQLIYWNKIFIKIFEEIFKNKFVLHISSTFPRKGVAFDYYNNDSKYHREKKIIFFKKIPFFYYLSTIHGIGDTGIIHIKRFINTKLKFSIGTDYTAKNFFKIKFRKFFTFLPFVAHLPWSAVVRKNKVEGCIINNGNKLLLKKIYLNMYSEIMHLNKNKKEIWQEDLIEPYKWWMIYPPIYTDFNPYVYLKNLFISVSINKSLVIPYYTSYKNKKINLIKMFFLRKKKSYSFSYLLITFFYYKLLRLIKKIL